MPQQAHVLHIMMRREFLSLCLRMMPCEHAQVYPAQPGPRAAAKQDAALSLYQLWVLSGACRHTICYFLDTSSILQGCNIIILPRADHTRKFSLLCSGFS